MPENIPDQLPDTPEFTPPVYEEGVEKVGVVPVGEAYYHGNKKVIKPGHIKEYYENK